jgi:hypothetical protein
MRYRHIRRERKVPTPARPIDGRFIQDTNTPWQGEYPPTRESQLCFRRFVLVARAFLPAVSAFVPTFTDHQVHAIANDRPYARRNAGAAA